MQVGCRELAGPASPLYRCSLPLLGMVGKDGVGCDWILKIEGRLRADGEWHGWH